LPDRARVEMARAAQFADMTFPAHDRRRMPDPICSSGLETARHAASDSYRCGAIAAVGGT
jgi:hypothetical protein